MSKVHSESKSVIQLETELIKGGMMVLSSFDKTIQEIRIRKSRSRNQDH